MFFFFCQCYLLINLKGSSDSLDDECKFLLSEKYRAEFIFLRNEFILDWLLLWCDVWKNSWFQLLCVLNIFWTEHQIEW